MVDALVAGERVRSAPVEEALRAVPRHLFLPGAELEAAYADDAVVVQRVDGVATSSASQPSMVAIMLEQLALAPGHRVLEIGAGTGWNAALMARIVGPAGSVTAVDIDADLIASAAGNLAAAGVAGVALLCADGALGHPSGAPYDRIVLTVGSADVRPEWVAQLAPGGRLLLPLAVRGSQLSMALDLGSDGLLRSDSLVGCGFIRLRGIGAVDDRPAPLADGVVLHLADADAGADVDALTAALREPVRPPLMAVPIGAEDVFDGFGLWLALTEPGAARLLGAADPDGVVGPHGVAVGLISSPGAARQGLAVVAPGAHTDPATVHAFGQAGAAIGAQLATASAAWKAAGCPQASDWRITVGPSSPEPAPTCSLPRRPATAVVPGSVTVLTERARLVLELPPDRP